MLRVATAQRPGFACCIKNYLEVHVLAAVKLPEAVGFLPTILISHSERTREAKWDSSVLVDACKHHELHQLACSWVSLHVMLLCCTDMHQMMV